MGWNEWSNGKKGGVIGGSVLAGLIVIGAAIGIGFAVSKPKKELDMWVPWTDTTTQFKALDQIAELYNQTNPEYTVNVVTAGAGGYKESGFTETSNLLKKNLKHPNKMPDIVINNQDALAILQTAGMVVNLQEEGLKVDNLYINNQDAVSGVVEQGGDVMAIRFYSTQNIGIDIPMLNWFVAQAPSHLSIKEDTNIYAKSQEVAALDTTEDEKVIASHWRLKDEATIPDSKTTGKYEISDATFESQEELHLFADSILTCFDPIDEAGNVIEIKTDDSRGVVAYTNPQTEFLTATQSHLGGVASSDQMIVVSENGNEYRFLTDSEQYAAAGDVWEDFARGMEEGEYWLPGSTGLYSSSMVANHWSIATIGSTSGTSFNVGSEESQLNSDEIYYVNDYAKFKNEADTTDVPVYKSQGPSMMAVNRGLRDQDERTDATIDFMNWLISDEKVANINPDGNVVSGDEMTAGTAFSIVSDFLLDSNGAVEYVGEKVDAKEYGDAVEPGLALTYETLTDGSKSANLLAEPNDQHTGDFWNIVKSEMNNQQTDFTSGTSSEIESWDSAAKNIVDEVNKSGLDAREHIEAYTPTKSLIREEVILNERR